MKIPYHNGTWKYPDKHLFLRKKNLVGHIRTTKQFAN